MRCQRVIETMIGNLSKRYYCLPTFLLIILALAFPGCGQQNLDALPPLTLIDCEDRVVDSSEPGCLLIKAHDGALSDVVFSPNANQVATSSIDECVRIWNADTGECLTAFNAQKYTLALAYSPDGKKLYCSALNHGIYSVDTETYSSKVLARTDSSEGPPQGMVVSPSGELVAVGTKPVWLFRTSDFKLVAELRGHAQGGDTLAFSPDGNTLVSGNADHTAIVWDIPSETIRFKVNHGYWVGGVDIHPQSGDIITSSFDRGEDSDTHTIAFIDPRTGKRKHEITGETLRGILYPHSHLSVSPDGRYIVSVLDGAHDTGEVKDNVIVTIQENNVSLWDAMTRELIAKQKLDDSPQCVAWSPDSSKFAVADEKGFLALWNLEDFISHYDASPEE